MGNRNSCKAHHVKKRISNWFIAFHHFTHVFFKTSRNFRWKIMRVNSQVEKNSLHFRKPTEKKKNHPKATRLLFWTYWFRSSPSKIHMYVAAIFSILIVVAGAEVRMIWGEELEDGCFGLDRSAWEESWMKQPAPSKVSRCVLRQVVGIYEIDSQTCVCCNITPPNQPLELWKAHTTCPCLLVKLGNIPKKRYRRLSFTSVWSLPAATLTSASVENWSLESLSRQKRSIELESKSINQCISGCQSEQKAFKTKHDPNIWTSNRYHVPFDYINNLSKDNRNTRDQCVLFLIPTHDQLMMRLSRFGISRLSCREAACYISILSMDVFHQGSFGGFGRWVMLSPPRDSGILHVTFDGRFGGAVPDKAVFNE